MSLQFPPAALQAVGLRSLVGLGAEVRGGRAGLGKITGEDGLEEGAEDDLGTTSLGKGHPEDEDKLEGVVEGEPVNSVDRALKNSQKGISNPVRQPLRVIDLGCTEQGIQGIVGWEDEASSIDEELPSNVEEDQEEVEGAQAKDHVDLRDGSLLLKIVESRILGQLFIELRDLVGCAILERHDWRCK